MSTLHRILISNAKNESGVKRESNAKQKSTKE